MGDLCTDCGQPMLPPGETKRPNEYDHASGCPQGLSPKQRLKRAVAAEMADMVHRSRKRSDLQRAIDAALADQRAFIAGWLRGMARGVRGEPLPGVDRTEMAEQIAEWIEKEIWREVTDANALATAAYHAAMQDAKRRRKRAHVTRPLLPSRPDGESK